MNLHRFGPGVSALLTLLLNACSNAGDGTVDGDVVGLSGGRSPATAGDEGIGEGGRPEDPGPAYLLMHTVNSPEGRQNYLYVEPSLDIGDLDPTGGREVSGASRSFVLDGKVFVA